MPTLREIASATIDGIALLAFFAAATIWLGHLTGAL